MTDALVAVEHAELIEAKKPSRVDILLFESELAQTPGAMFDDCFPLIHSFAPGMYVREIFIPKGMMLTGKIHRHAHPNVLLTGEVLVVTEAGGREHLKAPMSMISPAGTKRVIVAIEDTRWITFHLNPSDTQDLVKLEEEIIAKSYDEFETQNQLSSEVQS